MISTLFRNYYVAVGAVLYRFFFTYWHSSLLFELVRLKHFLHYYYQVKMFCQDLYAVYVLHDDVFVFFFLNILTFAVLLFLYRMGVYSRLQISNSRGHLHICRLWLSHLSQENKILAWLNQKINGGRASILNFFTNLHCQEGTCSLHRCTEYTRKKCWL